MKPSEIYLALIESGYPEQFAGRAIQNSHLYDGNVDKFADLVEQLIENENKQEATLMDAGGRKVEHDYTGDNLTTGGYDHIDKNKRW